MSAEAGAENTASAHADNELILEEITALRAQIANLSEALGSGADGGACITRGASP